MFKLAYKFNLKYEFSNMAYFLALALIACGLVIAIPAYLTMVDIILTPDPTQVEIRFYQEGKSIVTQIILGGLTTVTGLGLFIWKTFTSGRQRTQPTISVEGSSVVQITYAQTNAIVTNTIKDLQQSTSTDIKQVANLLFDLKTAIDAESNFSSESKADALEQINRIGEATKESSPEIRKSLVKNAIRILKGMATEIPDYSKFASACSKILPKLTSLFSLL